MNTSSKHSPVPLKADSPGFYDVEKIREDFPILKQLVNNKPLVYLDNAASTQKPRAVIDALVWFYTTINANIHRGIHTLSEKGTAEYEHSREAARKFIGAAFSEEIIFTKGTTESVNLVASTWGRQNIKKDDVIILTAMEHHSNMVPWQMLAAEKGAKVKFIPINGQGEVILEEYENLLKEGNVKIVAVNHVSNTLGTINPVKEIAAMAKKAGAVVLADGAQAASHLDINVIDLDVDFYALSAHKLYGPTGIGILYGKKSVLEAMPPYQGGGEMIREVSYEACSYNDLPFKFEAGTPNIADAIVMKSAFEYIEKIGKANIRAHEMAVYNYAAELLSAIDGVRFIGTAREKVSVLSFVIDGVHHQDLGILLDQEGIAVRTGHHCTQPLMSRLGIAGTARASFAMYNTFEEADKLAAGITKAVKMLR
jgi:cysteine desulfurase / selenocysteine lyase